MAGEERTGVRNARFAIKSLLLRLTLILSTFVT